MKKLPLLICLSVLICALGVACGDGDTPLPVTVDPPDIPNIPPPPPADMSKYDDYYMNGREKIALTKMHGMTYIVFREGDTQSVTDKIVALGAEIETLSHLGVYFDNPEGHLTDCRWAVVSAGRDEVSKIAELIYATPIYTTSGDSEMIVSPFLTVTLDSGSDLTRLKRLAEESKMLFTGGNKFVAGQYALACTGESAGNALQMVNWLYEQDMVKSAYADIFGVSIGPPIPDNLTRPVSVIPDDVTAFFEKYLPRVNYSRPSHEFSLGEIDRYGAACLAIDSVEEFRAAAPPSAELPTVDFEAYTLIIGQHPLGSPGYSLKGQGVDIEPEIMTLRLAYSYWGGVNPAVETIFSFWGLYPKLPHKPVIIDISM
jgi:hypothetical protein